MPRKPNAAFMSGVPELLVLQLLSRREMYGYELVREIRVVSEEAFKLAEGVVYPLLHSLEQKKLLKALRRTVNGRNRVYYSLTAKGSKRLADITGEWQKISRGLGLVLEGSNG